MGTVQNSRTGGGRGRRFPTRAGLTRGIVAPASLSVYVSRLQAAWYSIGCGLSGFGTVFGVICVTFLILVSRRPVFDTDIYMSPVYRTERPVVRLAATAPAFQSVPGGTVATPFMGGCCGCGFGCWGSPKAAHGYPPFLRLGSLRSPRLMVFPLIGFSVLPRLLFGCLGFRVFGWECCGFSWSSWFGNSGGG